MIVHMFAGRDVTCRETDNLAVLPHRFAALDGLGRDLVAGRDSVFQSQHGAIFRQVAAGHQFSFGDDNIIRRMQPQSGLFNLHKILKTGSALPAKCIAILTGARR